MKTQGNNQSRFSQVGLTVHNRGCGLSQRPKELAFHIIIIIIIIIIFIKSTNTTRRNDWKHIQTSLVAVVVLWFRGLCVHLAGVVGGLGPNRKVKLEVQDKIFSCSPLKKQKTKKKTIVPNSLALNDQQNVTVDNFIDLSSS